MKKRLIEMLVSSKEKLLSWKITDVDGSPKFVLKGILVHLLLSGGVTVFVYLTNSKIDWFGFAALLYLSWRTFFYGNAADSANHKRRLISESHLALLEERVFRVLKILKCICQRIDASFDRLLVYCGSTLAYVGGGLIGVFNVANQDEILKFLKSVWDFLYEINLGPQAWDAQLLLKRKRNARNRVLVFYPKIRGLEHANSERSSSENFFFGEQGILLKWVQFPFTLTLLLFQE